MGTFKAGDKVTGLEYSSFSGGVTPGYMQGQEYGVVRDGNDDANVQVYNQGSIEWFPYNASDLKLYKEKKVATFKKGDLVQYTTYGGKLRVGIVDRVYGSQVWAFWADTLGEAKEKEKANGSTSFIGFSKVSKYQRTLSDVEIGDKLTRYNNEVEVVSVSNGYVVTSDIYDGSNDLNAWKVEELSDCGIELLEEVEEPEITEVTLDEIADKLGIDVSSLRIKE